MTNNGACHTPLIKGAWNQLIQKLNHRIIQKKLITFSSPLFLFPHHLLHHHLRCLPHHQERSSSISFLDSATTSFGHLLDVLLFFFSESWRFGAFASQRRFGAFNPFPIPELNTYCSWRFKDNNCHWLFCCKWKWFHG